MSIDCRSVHALILPSCLCSRIVTLSLSVYCHSVNWHMLLVCPYPCTVTLFTPMSMHCHSVHVLVRPPFPCQWSVTLCMFKYVSLPMSMHYHLIRGITLSMAIYCHSTHTHVLSLCPCLRTWFKIGFQITWVPVLTSLSSAASFIRYYMQGPSYKRL